VLFRNAWSNPNCSPTRATILTGRYGFRTGIGDGITPSTAALSTAEVTLPELLDVAGAGYACGAFGKWHLGNESNGGLRAPNLAGFDHYDGCLLGALEPPPPGTSFFHWPRTVNGVKTTSTTYATTATVDSALAWIQARSEPWFCYVAFNAPHYPYHQPPAGMYFEDLTGLDPATSPRPFYKAALEALDTELGRLLAGISLDDTIVIFIGDNGSPPIASLFPFLGQHAKPTVYEGGVNVPLIVAGPAVAAGRQCQALVNLADLFTTVAELAGVNAADWLPGTKLDSVSMVPYFAEPALPSERWYVYTERFRPLGATGPVPMAHRAIRDSRYKLVTKVATTEFYDLWLDPFESSNLLPSGLTPSQSQRFHALLTQQEDLINDP
jgi:arylsulfatase A-like enzyme